MTDTIRIRGARPDDLPLLCAYNRAMAKEVEGLDLDPEILKAGLRTVLGDPTRGFYRVAEIGERVVGQLMITFEWSDWRNGFFFWIQSVYVLPEFRRQGVYRRLYADILAMAESREDVCGIRLAVARGNQKAKATYETLGMELSIYDMYEVDFAHGGHASRAGLDK